LRKLIGLREQIERALAERAPGSNESNERVIARTVVRLAADGDMKAIEFLGARIWPATARLDAELRGAGVLLVQDFTGKSLVGGRETIEIEPFAPGSLLASQDAPGRANDIESGPTPVRAPLPALVNGDEAVWEEA
jgi:hypothetical protein